MRTRPLVSPHKRSGKDILPAGTDLTSLPWFRTPGGLAPFGNLAIQRPWRGTHGFASHPHGWFAFIGEPGREWSCSVSAANMGRARRVVKLRRGNLAEDTGGGG